MLLEKNPCEGCLVIMLCEQMCPKVIKFYSAIVRKRPKHEVEVATGYHWEDDYIDDKTGKVINIGGAIHRIEREEDKEEPVKSEQGTFKKIINWLKTEDIFNDKTL